MYGHLLAVNVIYVTYILLASVSLFINDNVYIIDLLMVLNKVVHLMHRNYQICIRRTILFERHSL